MSSARPQQRCSAEDADHAVVPAAKAGGTTAPLRPPPRAWSWQDLCLPVFGCPGLSPSFLNIRMPKPDLESHKVVSQPIGQPLDNFDDIEQPPIDAPGQLSHDPQVDNVPSEGLHLDAHLDKGFPHRAAAYRQENRQDCNAPNASCVSMLVDIEELKCVHYKALSSGAVIPNVVLLACFSHMGIGLDLYNIVAPKSISVLGDLTISCAGLFLVSCFVLDLRLCRRTIIASSALVVYGLLFAGAVLKGRKYPWGPMLFVLFHIPLAAGLVRLFYARRVRRSLFYTAVCCITAGCAAVVLLSWILWILIGDNGWNQDTKDILIQESSKTYEFVYKKRALVYKDDCGPEKDVTGLGNDERAEIKKACASAATMWFLVWVCPFIAVICNCVISAFCFLQGVMINLEDASRLEKILKQFVLGLALMLAGMYASVSLSGASLRLGSTFMAFFGTALFLLMVWTYVEVGSKAIADIAKRSNLTQMLFRIWENDWSRAVFIGALNVIIPAYFALTMLQQRVRRCRGTTESADQFTPEARRVLVQLSEWRWSSILIKVVILGELFFTLQVGVAKITYVLLSALNHALAPVDYTAVIIMVFLIGLSMFLLPPVPGVPVYVFCGIVLAEQGRQLASVGFVGGCLIAITLGFFTKLCACLGQYGIGYAMGKSVKIQQLIHVDKPFTRAIEKILNRPGLDAGKVAVLVGGPDWPTSVTCGILKLNIPQMILGTCPVFFVLTPCVLAGAFMARVTGGEDSMWNMLANTAIGASLVVQMGSGVMAVYSITNVVQSCGDELSRPRPEHEAVAALTSKESRYVEMYGTVTDWRQLWIPWKAVVLLAAASTLTSGFIFVMMAESCFRPFNISSRIGARFEEDGLEGNVLNLVLPVGWLALALFAVSVVLHVSFSTSMSSKARRRLMQVETSSS